MWYEIAVISAIFAVGNILFGHFEEGTPKWRRLLKYFVFVALFVALSYFFGRRWFHIVLIALIIPMSIVHVWWLRKRGIDPWTAEPRDKYYEIRGWKKR